MKQSIILIKESIMKNLNKIHIFNILLITTIFICLIIPMTHIDMTSAFYHDGRWWANQYFDFKTSFPHVMPISFAAYNNTGLAINMFYPTSTLRLLEVPLILLNVQNAYIVMGYLNIISISCVIISIYLIASHLNYKNKLLISLTFGTIYMSPLLNGPVNSITQQIATALMYLGIYGIIAKKYQYVTLSTFLLLNTSISSSIIAAIAFFTVMVLSKHSKTDWINFIGFGIIGVVLNTPSLLTIISNLHAVQPPTDTFSFKNAPITILGYFSKKINLPYIGVMRIVNILSISTVIWVVYLSIKPQYKKKIILPLVLIVITALPKLNSILSTPIQQGTWSRTWPVLIVLTLLLFQYTSINKKYYLVILSIIASLNIMTEIANLNLKTTISKTMQSNINNENWNAVYSEIQAVAWSSNEHSKEYDKTLTLVAKFSPDYMPKKATLHDNTIAYNTVNAWKSKYGLEKHAIDKGRKLKITINPKHNTTPLGVWHYDFLKYNVSSTKGQVVVSNHDMFEYHGTKKTTIFISLK